MTSLRRRRKIEHIEWALRLQDGPLTPGWEAVRLLPVTLPGVALTDVDLSVEFLGKKLEAPLLINAMTGGHPEVVAINRALGRVARRTGLAVAVGSQRAALEDDSLAVTYAVVREENPYGVVLANLNFACRPEEALSAVAMVGADAIQLYFNAAQEAVMAEGETDFSSGWPHLQVLVREVQGRAGVPVIAKETGCGMTAETVARLLTLGIRYVDVGGAGGTNFLAIEAERSNRWRYSRNRPLLQWGIPTAEAVAEALVGEEMVLKGKTAQNAQERLFVIAGGGVRCGWDAACALALGADLVAIARPVLQILLREGEEALLRWLEEVVADLRCVAFLVGAVKVRDLQHCQMVVTGRLAEWLERRGIAADYWRARSRRSGIKGENIPVVPTSTMVK